MKNHFLGRVGRLYNSILIIMKVSSILVLLASTALAGKPQTTPCDDDKTATSTPQPQSQGWGSPSPSLSVQPHSQWLSSEAWQPSTEGWSSHKSPTTTPCESNTVVPVSSPAWSPVSTGLSSQPWIPTTIASSAPAVPTGPDVTTKTSTYTTTTCPGKIQPYVFEMKH